MSEFERQLREHYESQNLPEERLRATLAAGREAAKRHAARRRTLLVAAALIVTGLGLYSIVRTQLGDRSPLQRIVPGEAAAAIAGYFSQPGYQLARVSANPSELAQWLRANGAPPSFAIPRPLLDMPSFGCHVLDVRGQRVFLICFFPDVSPAELAAGGMIKNEMVVTAPDGTMMKKTRPLVHLVFAPRDAFREPPAPGTRVSQTDLGKPW
jgi:hypothetical protein